MIAKDKDRTTFLNIDPSFNSMGVSIFNPKYPSRFNMKTGDFNFILKWIGTNCKLKNVVAIVENPNLNSNVFGTWQWMQAEIRAYEKHKLWMLIKAGPKPRKVTLPELQSVFARCQTKAQSVGRNKESAKLIIQMLHKKGVPVLEVCVSDRQKAFKENKLTGEKEYKNVKLLKMPTKTNQEQFFKLTGFNGQCSEHARDAHTLCHGRTLQWFWMMYKLQEEKRSKTPNAPGQGNRNYSLIQRKQKTV